MPEPSNWSSAKAQVARENAHVLDRLICPRCSAMNRPGAHIIERTRIGFLCSVCATEWVPAAP